MSRESSKAASQKCANVWTARIIPLILIGIVGYVTWVVVVLVCVEYLLKPPPSIHAPRHGAAIAVLVLYFLLLLLMAFTYFRLLYTVATNPGYVPRSAQWYAQREEKMKGRRRSARSNKKLDGHGSDEKANGRRAANPGRDEGFIGYSYAGPYAPSGHTTNEAAPGLQDFFKRDVFVCQGDGRPIWCSTCLNWKPDRAHHCREVNHCVRKMDHFCPWVGGMVSETTFKFFIQFVAWTAVYCIFVLILMAILVAEYNRIAGTVNVSWVVTLGLAALFGLFTVGMSGSSLQFALVNTTTIENLSRKSIVWQLAVHMPKPPAQPPGFPTIAYSTAQKPPGADPSTHEPSPNTIKTFAILHSKPGENPWDLGPYENFKTVMGEHWYDWILPIKHSPCANHDRDDSQFALGPAVQRMRKEAGILLEGEERRERHHRRRRHRRRHRRKDLESSGVVSEKQNRDEAEPRPHSGHDRQGESV